MGFVGSQQAERNSTIAQVRLAPRFRAGCDGGGVLEFRGAETERAVVHDVYVRIDVLNVARPDEPGSGIRLTSHIADHDGVVWEVIEHVASDALLKMAIEEAMWTGAGSIDATFRYERNRDRCSVRTLAKDIYYWSDYRDPWYVCVLSQPGPEEKDRQTLQGAARLSMKYFAAQLDLVETVIKYPSGAPDQRRHHIVLRSLQGAPVHLAAGDGLSRRCRDADLMKIHPLSREFDLDRILWRDLGGHGEYHGSLRIWNRGPGGRLRFMRTEHRDSPNPGVVHLPGEPCPSPMR